MTPADIQEKLHIPEWDQSSAIKVSEAEFIYGFIREHNLKQTLEIGFAFARAASHIMAATEEPHIACDPFQERYQNIGLKNIETLGFSGNFTFYPEFSHDLLPRLKNEGRQFDFIFVDGDHKFDGEFIDFYYSDFLLRQGGYVMFHDTWMRSTRLVEHFIRTNRKDYRQVPCPLRNIIIFQKAGQDTRNGMHFREFYAMRSYLSYNLISWMTNGKDSFMKRVLLKVKEMVK